MTIEEFIDSLNTFLAGKVSHVMLRSLGNGYELSESDYNFDWEHDNGNLYIKLRINESVFKE